MDQQKPAPFLCRRNAVDSSHVGLLDIRIRDLSVVKSEESSIEGHRSTPAEPGAHESGIIRVFICRSEYQLCALKDYLEFGHDGLPANTAPRQETYTIANESEDCPYDLRDLVQWIPRHSAIFQNHESFGGRDHVRGRSLKATRSEQKLTLEDADAIFTFTELSCVPKNHDREETYGRSVQHKLYSFCQDGNRATMIWRCCDIAYSPTNPSECQQTFLRELLHGTPYFRMLANKDLSPNDMVFLLLLEIISKDVSELEHAVQREMKPKLTTDLTKATDSISSDYFQAMENRIYSFNRIKFMVEKAEDVNETWDYLRRKINLSSVVSGGAVSDFEGQVRSVSLQCSSLMKHTKRIDTRHQDLFALNTTVSQSRQASSTIILTVLAAVFLPLSLASAVLSMQTRLQDLGVLLYDFFGVAWLFCTFALICCWAVRYGTRLLDRFWSLKHLRRGDYDTWRRSIRGISYSYVVGWILVLVSFLLGMFLRDQTVDWRAYPFLALGIAVFVVAPVFVPVADILITVLCLFGSCCSFPRMILRRRSHEDHKKARGDQSSAASHSAWV